MNLSNPLHIALIGFGSQAQAWSQNLKDGSHQIDVYLRQDSTSLENVKLQGFDCYLFENLANKIETYDFILLLTPDHTHFDILKSLKLTKCAAPIILGHGYSHWKHQFNEKFPDLDFQLLAPKSIASEIRSHFLEKKPIYAACTNKNNTKLEKLARGIGITKLIQSSFEEEAIADLFSEQALLCGMIPYLANNCFEKLIESGTNPELAYIECWHEVKLIADAMIKVGPEGLFKMISPNALLGAEFFKNQILKDKLDESLDDTLSNIKKRGFIEFESQNDMNVIRTSTLDYWKNSLIQKQFEKFAGK